MTPYLVVGLFAVWAFFVEWRLEMMRRSVVDLLKLIRAVADEAGRRS